MAEDKSPDLEKLAGEVDAIVPGFGGLVRAVEAKEREIESVRALLERATEGFSPGLVLIALGREIWRLAALERGPIEALRVSREGNVYVRPEGGKRG
jgi:hypothetical protein